MPKQFWRMATLMMVSLVAVGCASTNPSDVRLRNYIEDRQRVDIDFDGNAGYIFGQAPADSQKISKETRKVYVVEFSKELPPDPALEELYNRPTQTSPAPTYSAPVRETKQATYNNRPKITIPPLDDVEPAVRSSAGKASSSAAGYENYTVTKNDTLQKISKQFYGSYSKWPRIYEANKNVIKNPDNIAPGTPLRIPVDQ